MKKQRYTMQDIATRSGITKMTVSRYLNNPESVAEETRIKISKAIEELGYIPNRAPAILSKSSSRAIGLIIPSFSNLVFPDVIHGVENSARSQGFNVLIAHTSYGIEDEEEQVAALLSYQVDALILTEPRHTDLTVKRIKSSGISCAEIMSIPQRPLGIVAGLDHKAITKAATLGFIDEGRRNLAYFGIRMDIRTRQRQEGYCEALNEANLPSHILLSKESSNFTKGAAMLREALENNPKLEAVICTNDDVAVGAMIACQELKLKVPKDIAILGFNGLNIGQATRPRLSSIGTPRYEMGKIAADMLIEDIRMHKLSHKIIKMACTLTDGDSIDAKAKNFISARIDAMNLNDI